MIMLDKFLVLPLPALTKDYLLPSCSLQFLGSQPFSYQPKIVITKIIRLLFVLLSFMGLLYFGYLFWTSHRPLKKNSIANQNVQYPQSISFFELNLPIFPVKANLDQIPTVDNGAAWLMSSPIPGEVGNSIIYAHNWPNLFGKLSRLKVGDSIQIKFPNNANLHFLVTSRKIVSAKNAIIPTNIDKPLLILYTCSGFFSQNRLIVTATPLQI